MHDEKYRKFSKGSNVKLCSALEKTRPTIVLNGKKSTAKTFTERFFALKYSRIPQT